MRRSRIAMLLAAGLMLSGPASAVQPDEVLGDAALEARARDISSELRCLVCQNQSIDDSDAALARDLRVLVRERLTAGDSDRDVVDYVVSRYGEYVLLRPRLNWRNAALWGTPALLLVLGGTFIIVHARRGRKAAATPLSTEEERRLGRLLGDVDGDITKLSHGGKDAVM